MKEEKKFPLENDPIDYVLSVHIRNLALTYGKDKVKEVFNDLFRIEDIKEEDKKASNE